MPLKSFSILVPFDGVTTMAEVQEVESPLNLFIRSRFKMVMKMYSPLLKVKKMKAIQDGIMAEVFS